MGNLDGLPPKKPQCQPNQSWGKHKIKPGEGHSAKYPTSTP